MTLLSDSKLDRGQKVKILSFTGCSSVQERLQDLGLREGLVLEYFGRAPFKGPLLIKFKSCLLALREEEAECTQIQLV